ncbi:MAG: transcriptional regulator [Clostridiales bacterium]|nr:transcriptional regulator [Clostridiales bacterium]
MSLGLQILVYTVGAVVALAVAIALLKSKKPVRGLLGSSAQGICALAAVNVAGAFTGVSLGLNLLSGLCCVVLGIPGVIALLVLKVIFNV